MLPGVQQHMLERLMSGMVKFLDRFDERSDLYEIRPGTDNRKDFH